MDLVEIGGRIKAQRKSAGISQEKLAEMTFVSPHYIYEIERGMKSMSLETLMSISRALNISTDFILFGNQPSEAPTLSDKLGELDGKQRAKAENGGKLLPKEACEQRSCSRRHIGIGPDVRLSTDKVAPDLISVIVCQIAPAVHQEPEIIILLRDVLYQLRTLPGWIAEDRRHFSGHARQCQL